MNAPAAAVEPDRLPAAAATLLGAFACAHPDLEPRLWAREGERWRCVHPGAANGADGPAVDAPRRALEPAPGEQLVLELLGEAARQADADFLGAALAQAYAYEREARSAARELSERYEEINLLYSISEVLGSVLSLQAAARRILDEVAEVLAARRASLWVLDEAEQQLVLTAAVGEEGLSGPIPIDDPDSVTARVFRERQPLNVERGKALPRRTALDPRPHGQEAFLSVPINFTPRDGESRTVGVITLVGRRTDVRFNAGDERLLTAIASQVGAALETHRLMAESVRQQRLVRELELAHDLQLKLLPSAEEFEGAADVAARCAPADSVGGDFYHLFRLAGDRLGIMIGDVSSHGFSAALIMAMTMSAVAIYAQEAGPPAEVLRRVHRALIDELETTEMYLTLFYGVLDPAAGRLVYANAGHPHAFRVGADGTAERLGATNLPLGIDPLDAYAEADVAWAGDDLLCLFTDGLSEALAERAGGSGEAELLAEVARLRDRPPAEILERLFARADAGDPAVPADDRTAVLLRA